ncbi:integral membrane protein [Dendryphion nanum]|uniref:Integral membrane protein n=1 Tax=Dendryphion nanum TaxID=256645 RepID=A0A9P9EET7_9PLEO|nr:integral membrane protein [Dendryphion nanum]
MDPDPPPPTSSPSIFRWILGFLVVGACWGLTTPFMRRAAINYVPPSRPSLTDPHNSLLKRKILGIWYAVIGILSRPAYAVPLLLNVTGSVWFFVLIGKAELSLTVPITNSLAFLFTVLGEWWAEKKVISRDTWIGMGLVLGGIALCVISKTQ